MPKLAFDIAAIAADFERLTADLPADWALHELEGVCGQIVFNPDIKKAFSKAQDKPEEAFQVMRLIASDTSAPVQSFFALLAEQGKLEALLAQEQLVAAIRERLEGKTEVTMTTAIPLPEESRERLVGKLEAWVGGPVKLLLRQNPVIAAGCIVEIGNETYDLSLQNNFAEHVRNYVLKEVVA